MGDSSKTASLKLKIMFPTVLIEGQGEVDEQRHVGQGDGLSLRSIASFRFRLPGAARLFAVQEAEEY